MLNLHRPPGQAAWRLILAAFHHDDRARQMIYDEIGDCVHCWRSIAADLAGLLAYRLVADCGVDGAFRLIDAATAASIDACARDVALDGGVAH